jgi:hypothetical protein
MRNQRFGTILTLTCALAALALLASPAFAAGDEAAGTQRLVRGTVTTPDGSVLAFSTPAGKSFILTDREQGRYFRLTPKVVDEGSVRMKVEEFADAERQVSLARHSFALSMDGIARGGHRVPFGLTLTGITVDTRIPDPALQRKGLGEVEQQAECCVGCGPWTVCCEPSSGWCCDLECLNNGETCSACTAIQ